VKTGLVRLPWWLFLLLILPVQPLLAHDMGVSKTVLEYVDTESDLNSKPQFTYRLSVTTSVSMSYLISTPILPAYCKLNKPYQGTITGGQKVFLFSCKTQLKADDKIDLPWQRDGVLLKAKWKGGIQVQTLFLRENNTITVDLKMLMAKNSSIYNKAKRYLLLGVEHILTGLDHLLFVLGVLLLVTSPVVLLKTITAFTVAHSFTLALAFLQVFTLPAGPVEASIALSIVILALEVIRKYNGKNSISLRFPWMVAGGFGLLHGLGFASALTNLGVSDPDVPVALLFFNIGVEFGQLLFILIIICMAFLLTRSVHYLGATRLSKRGRDLTLAYGLGIIGMYWTLERSAVIFNIT